MDERQLIGQLKQGSYKAFDEIYGHYAQRLHAFCLTYTKSPEDTQDIVQETFVKLWQTHKSIRETDSLGPLLFTMAKNLLINAYNKRVNSQIYADYIAYRNSAEFDFADTKLNYHEFVVLVDQKIRTLPKTQQKVVRLSRFEGLSNKDIGIKLGLSEQTVKNQLSLAIKKLRIIFAPLIRDLLMLLIIKDEISQYFLSDKL